jgi:delta-aminolevulinic acid dehydratase/porphobilinogen synthase
MEMLLSMKRAGADIILSYFAKEVAVLLNEWDGLGFHFFSE